MISIEERFWAKVRKSPTCWEWTACRHPLGYGAFRFKGRTSKAHRVAWELTHGPIPDGLHVLHDCDNRACVRPDHLRLGTHEDNMRDRLERNAESYRAFRTSTTRLTETAVIEIRRSLRAGETQASIAAAHGVSSCTVNHIATGRRWAHVRDTVEV